MAEIPYKEFEDFSKFDDEMVFIYALSENSVEELDATLHTWQSECCYAIVHQYKIPMECPALKTRIVDARSYGVGVDYSPSSFAVDDRNHIDAHIASTRIWTVLYFWRGIDVSRALYLRIQFKFQATLAESIYRITLHSPVDIVSVEQGHEPSRFLRLFANLMIVEKGIAPLHMYSGSYESPGSAIYECGDFSDHSVELFQIHESSDDRTYVMQIECKSANLSSGDVFILRTDETVLVWFGKFCTEKEDNLCVDVLDILSEDRSVDRIQEGQEHDEFWKLFKDGRHAYATVSQSEAALFQQPARMSKLRAYSCEPALTRVTAWSQFDLGERSLILLDATTRLFVWFGRKTVSAERDKLRRVAEAYLTS
eukprot:259107_1